MTESDPQEAYLPKSGSWPHTVLLTNDGEEAFAFAKEAAARLLCETGQAACGCESCRKIRLGIHPDVWILDREEQNIGVEDIRALRRDVYVAPLEAAGKVYILRHTQHMNGAAQNAALKLFEEPPKGVYFLLLCNNPMALLQTVRSRCMIIDAGREEAPEFAGQEAEALAGGFAEALAAGDELTLFAFCQQNEKLKRAQMEAFFDGVLALLRLALRARSGVEPPRDTAAEKLAKLPTEALMRMTELIRERRRLGSGNVGTAHLMGTISAAFYAREENK